MLYTVDEVSKILKVHFQTTLRIIRSGKLKANKIGRLWRVSEEDLQEYLKNSKK